ncbi:MAG: HDOD domain-containing protein [Dehalococcoidia bacterium]
MLTPARLKELPPIPRAAREVLALASDREAGAADFARVIEGDPRMTLQLLRVANSAYFARSQPALRVVDAVITIGLRETARIAVACALLGELGPLDDALELDDVLRHGLLVGRAWQPHGDASGAAGTLVDAGVLALTLDGASFEDYVARVPLAESPHELHEIERRLFGLDRCAVADLVAETWELPPALREPLGEWHVCRSPDSDLYVAFNDVTSEFEHPLLRAYAGR